MKNNTNNAPSNASSQAKPMGRFEKLFSNRWFAMAVSAMLAVLLWLVAFSAAAAANSARSACPSFSWSAAAILRKSSLKSVRRKLSSGSHWCRW